MSVLTRIERRLLYRPSRAMNWSPREAGIPHEDVRLRTDDGLDLGAWFVPGDASRPIVLFCHGNHGNRSLRIDTTKFFHSIGVSAFLFDYRGYGDSQGSPTEAGLYADARAAFRHLVSERRIDPRRIVVHGRSLGGAVAIDLAAELRDGFGALVAESTFSSVREAVAGRRYGFLLARLVRSRFDSLSKIARVQRPVLITHGDRDQRISIAHGRLLHARAREPKWFFAIEGVGHGDLLRLGSDAYREKLARFLRLEIEA